MATNNYQLAIINPEVQDNYLVSEDTVTIHTFGIPDTIYKFHSGVSTENCTRDHLGSFSLIDNPTIKCKLELFFSKYDSSNVTLSFLTEVPPAYEYEISLYYVNTDANLVHVSDLNVKNVRQNDKFEIPCSSAFNNDISVLLRCDSFIFTFCSKISRKDILANFNKKPAFLLPTQITNCALLFENSALTNFTLIVEDREFRVHKEILAAKSPIFLSMFESEMKEKTENQVVIDGIEAEIFHEFLRYIYTNVVNDLNVHAEKLLMVAEKYDVPELKLVGSEEMCLSLTVENAVHALIVANRYNLKSLKERALAVIRNNIKSIIDTEDYKTLCKSGQACLLNEIVQMLI